MTSMSVLFMSCRPARSVKHCVAEVERPSLICLCDIWASFLSQSNNAQSGVGGPSVDQGG